EEGLNFAGNTGSDIHKDLGETLSIVGGLDESAEASDANIRVDSEDGELRIKLAKSLSDLDDITVGENGAPGKDGADGAPGIGLDGSDGTIGITGADGVDGADGLDGMDG